MASGQSRLWLWRPDLAVVARNASDVYLEKRLDNLRMTKWKKGVPNTDTSVTTSVCKRRWDSQRIPSDASATEA